MVLAASFPAVRYFHANIIVTILLCGIPKYCKINEPSPSIVTNKKYTP